MALKELLHIYEHTHLEPQLSKVSSIQDCELHTPNEDLTHKTPK